MVCPWSWMGAWLSSLALPIDQRSRQSVSRSRLSGSWQPLSSPSFEHASCHRVFCRAVFLLVHDRPRGSPLRARRRRSPRRRVLRARSWHSFRHWRQVPVLSTLASPGSGLWANRQRSGFAPPLPSKLASAAGSSVMPSALRPLQRQSGCRWSHRGCGCLTRRCSGPGCYLVLPDFVQLATPWLPVARGSRAAERQR